MKTILAHSFRGGTGKSTFVANMAYELAKQGKKVAMIDSDIQSPALHIHFGLTNEPGLVDVLYKNTPTEETLLDVSSLFSLKEKLFIIPSTLDMNALLDTFDHAFPTGKFVKILNDLEAKDFDFVIIDSHPGLHKEFMILSKYADHVLTLVRPNNQDYEGLKILKNAMEKLDISYEVVVNWLGKSHDALLDRIASRLNVNIGTGLPFSTKVHTAESRMIHSHHFPDDTYSQHVRTYTSSMVKQAN